MSESTPPRSTLEKWRALEAADRLRAIFDRHLEEMEHLSARVRTECHRLGGDGRRGSAYEAVLARVEAVHGRNRRLCAQAESLRDAGVRALSDLHYTALALLDYVADAESAGCVIADDWTVTAESAVAQEWGEVIAEARTALDHADRRGRRAIQEVGAELSRLVREFDDFRSNPGTMQENSMIPASAGVFEDIGRADDEVTMMAAGITADQLIAVMPELSMDRAREYLPALDAAMREGDITTPLRRAAFLAQLAHESCEFRYFEELGDDDYFRQYDPGQANTAAGNTEPGDGPRYHGRGPIQLTGRANYRDAGAALGLDLEGDPDLAARPDVGFRIAQWYWTSRGINTLADRGDIAAVTLAVNGGYHGLPARTEYFRRALEVLR